MNLKFKNLRSWIVELHLMICLLLDFFLSLLIALKASKYELTTLFSFRQTWFLLFMVSLLSCLNDFGQKTFVLIPFLSCGSI